MAVKLLTDRLCSRREDEKGEVGGEVGGKNGAHSAPNQQNNRDSKVVGLHLGVLHPKHMEHGISQTLTCGMKQDG